MVCVDPGRMTSTTSFSGHDFSTVRLPAAKLSTGEKAFAKPGAIR